MHRAALRPCAASALSPAGPSLLARPRLPTCPRPARHASSRPPPPRPRTPAKPADTPPPIPFTHVHVVDPATSALGPLVAVRALLASLDASTHAVRLVSSSPPVVRVLDLVAERDRQRAFDARMRMNRKVAFEDKEVQVSWGAAEGDLAHKAAAARAALERGDRVTLVFAARAAGGSAQAQVAQQRRAEVLSMFDDELGVVGQKWRDDTPKGAMLVSKWKPKDDVAKEVRQKVVEGEVEKRKAKDEKKEARRRKEEERERKARERQA